ncbi:MAG TPA: hypothetical protein VFP97_06960 [Chitinophagaceae bacterium]|nr:hypothetical protein [Chitinophagaceae bacterium]
MRILLVLPVMCLIGSSPQMIISGTNQPDTTIVTHLLDGNTAEWPTEKFVTNKATKMEYAADNDKQSLFLALNVSDKNVQKRIMQDGLNVYIDIKGKKKENRGIEFPVKMGNITSIENLKLFGFSDGEPRIQSIKNEGTVNIAIAWDTSYVMHIEYSIPLKMLEETVADLNTKKISIGWKLQESELPSITSQHVPTTTTTRQVGVPAGTRPSGSSQGVSNANSNTSFWTSHTITF